MLWLLFCLSLVGYAQAQWQYGGYPRYGYVYNHGGSTQFGFGYYNKPAEVSRPTVPRQTVANYYQPGSILNPSNLARTLSPTNVKVVDYNSGQVNGYYTGGNPALIPKKVAQQTFPNRQPSQVPRPLLPVFGAQNQNQFQPRINQMQRELEKQHQQKMIQQVQRIQETTPPRTQQINNPPAFIYPRQGFITQERPKVQTFQNPIQYVGSSYLPSGAGRTEDLKQSLGIAVSPTMQWIKGRVAG